MKLIQKDNLNLEINNIEKITVKPAIDFTNNVLDLVNNRTEFLINKYIKKIKNKDKSVINDLNKDSLINLNNIVYDNLNILWKNSFFSVQDNKDMDVKKFNFADNNLSFFAGTKRSEVLDLSTKFDKRLNKEDKKVARKIRTRDIQEKKRTERILQQPSTDQVYQGFANDYLTLRNKEVAKNFTDTYKEKIFSSINNYLNSKLNISREKNLINHLSFKDIKSLSNEEKQLYLNELQLEKERIKNVYGLSVLEDYGSLKWSPKQRIQRIGLTELSAAYNLGRFNKLVDMGFTEFIIRKNKRTVCALCQSLNGQLVTLSELSNIGYQDFKGIDTRQPYTHPKNQKLSKFPVFHSNCGCSLIGNPKQKKEEREQNIENKNNNIQNTIQNVLGVYNKYSKISTVINISRGLSNTYLNYLQDKRDEEEQRKSDERLKLLLSSSAILSSSLMIFFYLKNKQNIDEIIEDKIGESIVNFPLDIVQKTTDKIETVLEKNITINNQFEYNQKPLETNTTVNQYVENNNQEIITNNLIKNIKNYVDKNTLERLLNQTVLSNLDLTSLVNRNELLKYNELELLLKTLIKNENIKTEKQLLDLIYKETKEEIEKNVLVKIPLNIKEEDKVLINPLQNKQLEINKKINLYDTSINNLYKNVKQNKTTYLKDIDKLKELDNELTNELIGLDYINKEYLNLLDTVTDENLKKYLTDKIEENKNKTIDIRNKLNNVSEELYDKNYKNLDKLSIDEKENYKNQLIEDVNKKSKEYLDFRNTRKNDIASLNKKLSNLKENSNELLINKDLNLEDIDELLNNANKLNNDVKSLDNKTLLYDSILYDATLLSKLDENVNIKNLNYLTKTYDFNKEIKNVDNFKINILENYKNKLNNYIKNLTKTKYNLLNNEQINITEFKYKKLINKIKKISIFEKSKIDLIKRINK